MSKCNSFFAEMNIEDAAFVLGKHPEPLFQVRTLKAYVGNFLEVGVFERYRRFFQRGVSNGFMYGICSWKEILKATCPWSWIMLVQHIGRPWRQKTKTNTGINSNRETRNPSSWDSYWWIT